MALPQLHPPHPAPSPYSSATADSRRIDILIADDEAIVRRLLEISLRAAGLRVVTAANGADAVRLYESHQGNVGLVLLDVQMPELTGPQAFAALRRITPDVHVAFMSGGAKEYTEDDLLADGAVAFLHKPFHNLDDVVGLLCSLVTSAAHAR